MKKFLSLLFVPQEKNNHKALLLQPTSVALLIVVYFFCQSLIKTFTITKPGILGYSSEITAQKVFLETNIQRQKNGLSNLHYNSKLSESAVKKATDMFENNYWAHTSPQGISPWNFFKDVDYQYSVAGENLAKDFYDTESLMTAWINSPTHKANIINTKYREIGIAVVNGTLNGVKTTLVVQHFGTPLNLELIKDTTTDEYQFNSLKSENLNNLPSTKVLSDVSVNPLLITKIISTAMFIIILVVLFIDGFVTVKNKTHRLGGSSAGHLVFLTIIFVLMIFIRQGSIF